MAANLEYDDEKLAYDLQIRNNSDFSSDSELEDEIKKLPPADGGREAWSVLAGAFCLECVVWGFPFAFGIFQTYYSTHEPFASQSAGLAAISTTATGIMYLSSPVVAIVLRRWPWLRRPAGLVGLAIMNAALIGASFANSTAVLLATQGVLFAVGALTLYFPAMLVIDEWFIARKGLAYGIAWTGTGTSGAIVPFLFQWLLDGYGFRTALRVWAVITTVMVIPALYFMKSRIPESQARDLRPLDLSFVKKAPFWWFQLGNFGQGLAYFLPQLWIPSFAAALGLPSFAGTLGLCLVNVAACGGYLLQGFLVDNFDVSIVMFGVALLSSISVFILWGLTTSQPMLYVFAILWGVSGGGFPATWSGYAQAMGKRGNYGNAKGKELGYTIDTGLFIGLGCISKGIASLITGPISEELLDVKGWNGGGFAYGTQYGPVIIFAGVAALLGIVACTSKLFKQL